MSGAPVVIERLRFDRHPLDAVSERKARPQAARTHGSEPHT